MRTRMAKYEVYRDVGGCYRGRLIASNGRIVFDCSEGYKKKSAVLKMAKRYLADRMYTIVDITDKWRAPR